MCLFKTTAWEDAKPHWLHLLDFSPLCIFKCLFKFPATEDAFVWFISLICSFPWTFFIAFSFSWIILSKILIHHQNSTGGLLPKSGFKLRTNLLWIWRQIKESKIKIYLTICFSDQQNMSRRHRLTIKTCPMWRQSDWNGMIVGMRSVSAQWAGERWFIRQLPFSINPQ